MRGRRCIIIGPCIHPYNAGTDRGEGLADLAAIACAERAVPWGVRRVAGRVSRILLRNDRTCRAGFGPSCALSRVWRTASIASICCPARPPPEGRDGYTLQLPRGLPGHAQTTRYELPPPVRSFRIFTPSKIGCNSTTSLIVHPQP